jgi:serine/threonine protein kinase
MSSGPPGDDGAFITAGVGIGPGSRVAGYQVVDRIGRGGMAVVYRARDERLGRAVALKVLAPVLAEDEAFRQRFIRESRAAATVDDPHIIPVFEAGEADGVLFIAMRYVAGGDVRSLLQRAGPLPGPQVASIVSPVASALDAAHAAGLVHRDVKPANMLIDTRPGRPDHVYLSDFGLSKGALSSVGLTSSGLFMGTPDYISPEQAAGRPADGRADQYALACAAFELLSGEPPFSRDHGMAVIYAHLNEPPPELAPTRPGLPAAVDAVLGRALAKDPADRFPDCGAFADALRDALGIAPYQAGPAPAGGDQRAAGVETPAAPALEASPPPPHGPGTTEDALTITSAAPPAWRSPDRADEHAADLPGRTGPAGGPYARRSRPSRRAVVLATGCVVIAAAVVVPLLAIRSAPRPSGLPAPKLSRSAPSVTSTGTMQASRSAPATAASAAQAASSSPSPRHVFTSQAAPVAAGGNLSGVAVVPGGGGAWAVGWNLPAQTPVIYHWDGATWTQSPSPSLAPYSELKAVAATSPTDAWAVGDNGAALVEHWDGSAWTQVAAPQPPPASVLNGVAAVSPASAWAVGYTYDTSGGDPNWKCLIEHWDGTSWTVVPTRPGGYLSAVTATSATDVWAVGSTDTGSTGGNGGEPLILHWDGTAWTSVPAPGTTGEALYGVAATSATDAWAVGGNGSFDSLILRWDGTAWTSVPAPSTAGGLLSGVTAASPTSAWAVGSTVLRWDGTAWQQVGHASTWDGLQGVATISPASAWAAGGTGAPFANSTKTVIVRWNDTA